MLQSDWTFYFIKNDLKKLENKIDYEDSIKKIGSFNSIQNFWAFFSRIKKPSETEPLTQIHLFKTNYKALWGNNQKGGKWMLFPKKEISNVLWEHTVLSLICEKFNPDIIGIVLSNKQIDVLSFWVNTNDINPIAESISKVLELPNGVVLDFKPHKGSNLIKQQYFVGRKFNNFV